MGMRLLSSQASPQLLESTLLLRLRCRNLELLRDSQGPKARAPRAKGTAEEAHAKVAGFIVLLGPAAASGRQTWVQGEKQAQGRVKAPRELQG